MVIERAEGFGLAQLHQLRGRVGRGDKESFCLLVYRAPLGEIATERIETLRRTDDGFEIAEADFKLRGPGDLLGHRQSGLPDFKVFKVGTHDEFLGIARKDMENFLLSDPSFTSERGQALLMLRELLSPEMVRGKD